MLTIIIVGATTLDTHTTNDGWNWNGFWNGFVSLAYQLRFDGFVVVFLIPTIGVGMILTRKKEPEDIQKIKRVSKKSK